MTNLVRGLRVASLAVALASSTYPALAQSGSTGGSIGNENKSLSGSRQDRSAEPAPVTPKSKPAPAAEQRSSSRKSGGGGGGGGGNFDGAWAVVSVGCGGSDTSAVVVSSNRIIGQGLTGTISPSGATSSVGRYGNITVISTGRVSGRSGAGTFRRSDGCSGTWTSSKQ